MELLEIVQSLHYEAKLPGAPPTTVVGQTGRAGDLVRWTIESYNDIQREKDGKWRWLRRPFTLNTVAGTQSYAYGSATDVDAATAIARFRAWDLDDRERPLIYLVSDGQATERELMIADWQDYRFRYLRGTHTSAPPMVLAAGVDNKLWLGPKPDGIYRVSGNFWRSNQVLAEDDDEPEMPADYHMLIVYHGLTKYAYNAVAHETLARAQWEGSRMWDALSLNQGYSRFIMSMAGALA